jgi:hypothetical protein
MAIPASDIRAIPASDIRDWSIKAFDQFQKNWVFSDFWTRANTFDACLGFISAALARWPGDSEIAKRANATMDLIKTDCDYFEKTVGGSGIWVDDYGWCGNASLTAYTYLSTISGSQDLAARFLDVARSCAANLYKTGWDPSGSPVPGGCRNSTTQEAGVKNTVTNASFLLLSARLTGLSTGDANALRLHLAQTYYEYQWFDAWCSNATYKYLQHFGDGFMALVQERPHYPPDYMGEDHPKWEPGWAWSADQGLVMGGFVEFARLLDNAEIVSTLRSIAPDADPSALKTQLLSYANNLAGGAKGSLFDRDHVLQEAPFRSSFDDDPKDYVCGRGVLLRYLARVRDTIDVDLGTQISATAASAWNNTDSGTHQFGADWNPAGQAEFQKWYVSQWGVGETNLEWGYIESDLALPIEQAAGLDALGAAIPLAV